MEMRQQGGLNDNWFPFYFIIILHVSFCLGCRLMRPEVLLASVLWEDIDSITKSKNMLNQFLYYNGTAIPPNLREVSLKCIKLEKVFVSQLLIVYFLQIFKHIRVPYTTFSYKNFTDRELKYIFRILFFFYFVVCITYI